MIYDYQISYKSLHDSYINVRKNFEAYRDRVINQLSEDNKIKESNSKRA